MGFKSFVNSPMPGPSVSPSTGTPAGTAGWHPTVLYMLGLVIAEIIVVAFLSRHLLK